MSRLTVNQNLLIYHQSCTNLQIPKTPKFLNLKKSKIDFPRPHDKRKVKKCSRGEITAAKKGTLENLAGAEVKWVRKKIELSSNLIVLSFRREKKGNICK